MSFVELIIETATNRINAAQEFTFDRGDEHDWGLMPGQKLIRFEGVLPKSPTKPDKYDNINKYLWNPEKQVIELNPAWVSPLEQAQAEWDANQAAILGALTWENLKQEVVKLLGARPE